MVLPSVNVSFEAAREEMAAQLDRAVIGEQEHRGDRHSRRAGFQRIDRMLQRLFATYVGVSPKWVIQRYRLHEAAEQLASGASISHSALALDLGYTDQAHFVHDFKAVVGTSPAAYARAVRRAQR